MFGPPLRLDPSESKEGPLHPSDPIRARLDWPYAEKKNKQKGHPGLKLESTTARERIANYL